MILSDGFRSEGYLVLANPPYFAGFRIARHFLSTANDALVAGGRIIVVTKRPDWYCQNIPAWFDSLTLDERKGYLVVCARLRTARRVGLQPLLMPPSPMARGGTTGSPDGGKTRAP